MRALLPAVAITLGLILTPSLASGVTVDQVVALSKAGVSESVILALIDRDRTILTIAPEQLVALKHEGVSDAVVAAMLRSGRDEGEAAVRAEADWNAASLIAGMSTAPHVVIVGHGPEPPDGVGSYRGNVVPYADSGAVLVPFGVPVFPQSLRAHARQRRLLQAMPSNPPTSFVAVPPNVSPVGIFFDDRATPARGIFFPPK